MKCFGIACFPLNCVIGFVTCSTINRRNLPIHGTGQDLLMQHPLSTQEHLWEQAAARLEGQNLPGKKTRMSIFHIAVSNSGA